MTGARACAEPVLSASSATTPVNRTMLLAARNMFCPSSSPARATRALARPSLEDPCEQSSPAEPHPGRRRRTARSTRQAIPWLTFAARGRPSAKADRDLGRVAMDELRSRRERQQDSPTARRGERGQAHRAAQEARTKARRRRQRQSGAAGWIAERASQWSL